jgi:hypothetical protein
MDGAAFVELVTKIMEASWTVLRDRSCFTEDALRAALREGYTYAASHGYAATGRGIAMAFAAEVSSCSPESVARSCSSSTGPSPGCARDPSPS